jgi:hypothetical protein
MRDSLGNSKLGFIISHCAEPARLIHYHTQFMSQGPSRNGSFWPLAQAMPGKHNFRIHVTSAKI